jgi:Lectin C-type domain
MEPLAGALQRPRGEPDAQFAADRCCFVARTLIRRGRAKRRPVARGGWGERALVSSHREWNWLRPQLAEVLHGYHVGGVQSPRSASPTTGWSWLTGSPIDPAQLVADDNPCGASPPDVEDGQQDFLHTINGSTQFGDTGDGSNSCAFALRSIIEWSSDCDQDGQVDFGQIQIGLLADADADYIPDCCEQQTICQVQPVQWSTSAGGNGHWYGLSGPMISSWQAARSFARDRGGHLVTITSAAEQAFVARLAFMSTPNVVDDCWIGAFKSLKGSENPTVAGTWRWVTDETWDFTSWRSDTNPNGGGYVGATTTVPADQLNWVPGTTPHEPGNIQAYIEWSADCNADGIVDYGQIRAGELADTNTNNIPDCCESGTSCNGCPGDVDGSGAVNGVDLAAVLGNWGTNGGKYPGADTNHDGVVDGVDLAQVLGNWGPCN